VPIILIGACAAYCILKNRNVKDTSTESWQYKPEMALPASMEPLKTSSFNTHRRSNGAESDYSDRRNSDGSLGGAKKRRMYDRSYRTNEPLPGKPPVEFGEKVWDLGEEEGKGGVNTALTTSDETPSDANGQAVYRHSRQTDIYWTKYDVRVENLQSRLDCSVSFWSLKFIKITYVYVQLLSHGKHIAYPLQN